MTDGIILAGGYSSRAKTNKMVLIYEGLPIICNAIEAMRGVCDNIVVVTGHYHDEVLEVVKHYDYVKVVKNQFYDKGMFSSVIVGAKEVKNDFFLTPGDYPMIQKETFLKLLSVDGNIRVPIFNSRKGHPIFISKELIESLLNEQEDSNLKVFRDKYDVTYVEVEDEGVLIDVDTISDYLSLKNRNERNEKLED
ncbi:MAG: nucleotidyltransferase family protein [Candidatus Izemoplasma sp.]